MPYKAFFIGKIAMPVTNGIGHSMMTVDKQIGFNAYIRLIIRIWNNVFKKHPYWNKFVYIDTNCGSGNNPDEGVFGSPIIFLEATRAYPSIPFDCHFIDIEDGNISQLQERIKLGNYKNVKIKYYCADNNDVLLNIIQSYKDPCGLIYMDTNGKPDFNLLRKASLLKNKLDIFFRCPTTAIKRVRCRNDGNINLNLIDELGRIEKQRSLIREPVNGDRWKFTFLFLTNYSEIKEWKNFGFYLTDSPYGEKILAELNYTANEIRVMKQPMLDIFNEVNNRSNGMCEVCGQEYATQRHHLNYKPRLVASDLVNICYKCHCKLEGVAE